ncbi:MAG: FkbM family methyltransferase [Gammaproteobacteria bacterium]|nr:FkbM family methyltransferase [Gammaproteobacteria bacterium]
MNLLNSIAENEIFLQTGLYKEFRNRPIGFVDVGSLGGVHPFILPVASLVNCLCFEPNEQARKEVCHVTKPTDFSRLIVYNTAISNMASEAKFYITKSEVNSSLLKPDKDFARRYSVKGFTVEKTRTVRTQTLDEIAENAGRLYPNLAEIIKLDCQGAEYPILQGASKVLENQCMVLWCEVEFFQVYENQKLFSDIDQLLRQKGFTLYGLYPNYISSKQMDRKVFETEERITWADALYIKDPLSPMAKYLQFSERSIKVLILATMLLKYFDFTCELIHKFIKDKSEKTHLIHLTEHLSLLSKKEIEKDTEALISRCSKDQERMYLYAKKFIDKNKGNNNIDFIQLY